MFILIQWVISFYYYILITYLRSIWIIFSSLISPCSRSIIKRRLLLPQWALLTKSMAQSWVMPPGSLFLNDGRPKNKQIANHIVVSMTQRISSPLDLQSSLLGTWLSQSIALCYRRWTEGEGLLRSVVLQSGEGETASCSLPTIF